MKEELVSVIVPIYNAEKELKRCVDSILLQTYHNLEILLIDDGSKDNSLNIAKQYEKKDDRIHVLHQENKGVSCARNLGIKNSTGKYLSFIDADDWIKDSFIETLVDTIQDYDMAIVGYSWIHGEVKDILYEREGNITKEEFFYNTLCNTVIRASCCNKLFVMKIVKDNKITFPMNVYFAEDTIFLMNYYRFGSKVKYCRKALYEYVYHEASATHECHKNSFNIKRLTLLELSDRIEKWYCDENQFIWDCIIYRRIRSYINILFYMIVSEDCYSKILKEMKSKTRQYSKRFVSFKAASLPEKIAALGICISPKMVYCFGKLGYRLAEKRIRKILD